MKDHEFDNNNPEHLLERLSALEAHKAGEQLELLSPTNNKWCIVGRPSFDNTLRYRRAPKPAVRLWNCPADVPGPVCWLRAKDRESAHPSLEAMIVAVSDLGITWFTTDYRQIPWKDTEKLSSLEHSADRVTWKALEVPV